MTDKIVDSFNIFVDTDQGSINSSSNGVDYELNLGNSKIDIRKGQHFKISLLNFSMYKTFTNVNRYNSDFVIKTSAQAPITLACRRASMRFRARVAPTAFRAAPRRVWANLLLGAFCSLGGGEAVVR